MKGAISSRTATLGSAAGRLAPLHLILVSACCGCLPDGSTRTVVVYTSLDQHYSQPILDAFEEETGIRVLPRYDTEASKTTGLYHRLLRERSNPQADVFWNSEVLRTVALAEKGCLAPYSSVAVQGIPAPFRGRGDLWTGFAARLRVLIYNTEQVREEDAPRSIAVLADPKWRGRACMALPTAGTTLTHVGALWSRLGDARAREFLGQLARNDVAMVNGNSVVRDLVARGDMAIGITDTDDANEGIRRGDPIRMVFPDQDVAFPGLGEPLGAFLIPNTVALVRGGPNSDTARVLFDYLVSAEVEASLAASGSVQIPLRAGVEPPPDLPAIADLKLMEVDFAAAATGAAAAEPVVRELFLR